MDAKKELSQCSEEERLYSLLDGSAFTGNITKKEFFVPTVEKVIAIGKDHVAYILIAEDSLELLRERVENVELSKK